MAPGVRAKFQFHCLVIYIYTHMYIVYVCIYILTRMYISKLGLINIHVNKMYYIDIFPVSGLSERSGLRRNCVAQTSCLNYALLLFSWMGPTPLLSLCFIDHQVYQVYLVYHYIYMFTLFTTIFTCLPSLPLYLHVYLVYHYIYMFTYFTTIITYLPCLSCSPFLPLF